MRYCTLEEFRDFPWDENDHIYPKIWTFYYSDNTVETVSNPRHATARAVQPVEELKSLIEELKTDNRFSRIEINMKTGAFLQPDGIDKAKQRFYCNRIARNNRLIRYLNDQLS